MKTTVLFLCTGNSARSQMAEGLLRHLGAGRFDVLSAGTHPVGLNPLGTRVMQEIGIDISTQRSKNVSEFVNKPVDVVVTVCDNAKQTCPVFRTTHKTLHWSVEDPAAASGSDEERLAGFRRIRDQIKFRIETELLNG